MAGLNNAAQGNHFKNSQDVSDNIVHMENDFRTDLYGCRVMLLDEQGTAYLSDGPAGIWYDVSHLLDENKRHTFVSETDTIDGSFLVFSQELDSPITMGENHVRFTHIVLLKDIQTVKQYYTTTTYGGSAATYIIKKNGTLAYFDADSDDEPTLEKKENFFTKNKHKNTKIIALCLVIVFLLGIGAGLVWIYVSTKSKGYGDDGIDYNKIDKNYLVDDNTQFKVMGDIDADSLNAFLYQWANNGGDKMSNKNIINVLLCGVDSEFNLCDSQILISIDKKNEKITKNKAMLGKLAAASDSCLALL